MSANLLINSLYYPAPPPPLRHGQHILLCWQEPKTLLQPLLWILPLYCRPQPLCHLAAKAAPLPALRNKSVLQLSCCNAALTMCLNVKTNPFSANDANSYMFVVQVLSLTGTSEIIPGPWPHKLKHYTVHNPLFPLSNHHNPFNSKSKP